MYSAGDILYIHSGTLVRSSLTGLTPADVDAALQSGAGLAKHGPEDGLSPKDPVVLQVRILQAFSPFTMAVVCRVRLIGVFESHRALAPHIPLPFDIDDNDTDSATAIPASDSKVLEPCGPEYILKLYDRRCFVNVREEYGCDAPYSEEDARAYEKYRAGTPAPMFTRDFWDMPGLSHGKDIEADTGLFEAWLEADARKTYRKELAVYNILGDLQGKSIPKLFDTVSCNVPLRFDHKPAPAAGDIEEEGKTTEREEDSATRSGTSHFVDWHIVHGILIEYVQGPSLRSFIHSCLGSANHLMRAELVSIADEAVAVTVEIGRHPVLNRDVRLDNMLVRESYVSTLDFHTPHDTPAFTETERSAHTASPEAVPPKPERDVRNALDKLHETRCVAIDFGHARPRLADETDEQWRCAKDVDDEETLITDAIQCEMQAVFKEHLSAHGSTSETRETLRRACRKEQQALWNYQPARLWHRELSAEEYEQYLADSGWGQHPNSRD